MICFELIFRRPFGSEGKLSVGRIAQLFAVGFTVGNETAIVPRSDQYLSPIRIVNRLVLCWATSFKMRHTRKTN
jgi:hypothetical protein